MLRDLDSVRPPQAGPLEGVARPAGMFPRALDTHLPECEKGESGDGLHPQLKEGEEKEVEVDLETGVERRVSEKFEFPPSTHPMRTRSRNNDKEVKEDDGAQDHAFGSMFTCFLRER